MNGSPLLNVGSNVSRRCSCVLDLHLDSEKLVFTHFFINDLPGNRILHHFSAPVVIGFEQSDQLPLQVCIVVRCSVRHASPRDLSLLLSHFKGVEAFIEALAVQEVLHLQRLSFQDQTHGHDDIALHARSQLSLGLASFDFQAPFLEQSLRFQVFEIDYGSGKPFAFLLDYFAHIGENQLGLQLFL